MIYLAWVSSVYVSDELLEESLAKSVTRFIWLTSSRKSKEDSLIVLLSKVPIFNTIYI